VWVVSFLCLSVSVAPYLPFCPVLRKVRSCPYVSPPPIFSVPPPTLPPLQAPAHITRTGSTAAFFFFLFSVSFSTFRHLSRFPYLLHGLAPHPLSLLPPLTFNSRVIQCLLFTASNLAVSPFLNSSPPTVTILRTVLFVHALFSFLIGEYVTRWPFPEHTLSLPAPLPESCGRVVKVSPRQCRFPVVFFPSFFPQFQTFLSFAGFSPSKRHFLMFDSDLFVLVFYLYTFPWNLYLLLPLLLLTPFFFSFLPPPTFPSQTG